MGIVNVVSLFREPGLVETGKGKTLNATPESPAELSKQGRMPALKVTKVGLAKAAN